MNVGTSPAHRGRLGCPVLQEVDASYQAVEIGTARRNGAELRIYSSLLVRGQVFDFQQVYDPRVTRR